MTTAGNFWTARVMVPCLGLLIACGVGLLQRGQMAEFVAWDFPLYYSAGRLPGPSLFDKAAQEADQRAVYDAGLAGMRPYHFSVYLKPAAYQVVLGPLARLRFWDAYLVWVGLQLAGFAGALFIFSRRSGFPVEWWVLLAVNPFLLYMVYWGQDTGLVLLALAGAWFFSTRGAWFTAGACLALCLVKWNLFILLVPLLVVQRKWRALAGFLCVAAAGAAVSVGLTGWDGVGAYLRLLRDPEADFLAAGMPSVRGQLLLAGMPDGLVSAAVVALNGAMWWLQSRLEWRLAFAVGLTGCVMLSYHTMNYDQLFLLPVALLLRDGSNFRSLGYMALFAVWIGPVAQLGPLTGLASVTLAATYVAYAYRQLAREEKGTDTSVPI